MAASLPPRDVAAASGGSPLAPRAWGALALLALLLALGLRVAFLANRGDLWVDEAISAGLARHDPADLHALLSVPPAVKSTVLNADAPLYYPLLRAWTWLCGDSEVALRSLSVLLGLASLVLLWKVLRDACDAPTAALGALLMAVAPLQVHYSTECRCYTLFLFATLGALASLLSILTKGKGFIPYVLCSLASVYTFYYGLFPILVANLVFALALVRPPRPRLAPWALAQLAILAGFLPWAGVVRHQRAAFSATSFDSWGAFWKAMQGLLVDLTALGLSPRLAPLLALLAAGLVVAGAVALRHKPLHAACLVLWLVLPILLHRHLATAKVVGRAFIFVTPALYALAAAAASTAIGRWRRPAAVATLVAFAAFLGASVAGAVSVFRQEARLRAEGPSLATLDAALGNDADGASVLVLSEGKYGAPLLAYYLQRGLPIVGFPSSGMARLPERMQQAQLLESLRLLAGAYPELWVCTPGKETVLPARTGDDPSGGRPRRAFRFSRMLLQQFPAEQVLAATEALPSTAVGAAAQTRLVRLGSEPALAQTVLLDQPTRLRWFTLAQYPQARPFYGRLELRVDGVLADSTLLGCTYASVNLLEADVAAGTHSIQVARRPP